MKKAGEWPFARNYKLCFLKRLAILEPIKEVAGNDKICRIVKILQGAEKFGGKLVVIRALPPSPRAMAVHLVLKLLFLRGIEARVGHSFRGNSSGQPGSPVVLAKVSFLTTGEHRHAFW